MTLPRGYRIRPVDVEADIPVAAAIQVACDLHDVGFADHEEIWIRDDWTGATFRGAWMVEDPGGEPCAYANLAATDPSSTIDVYGAILPEHRGAVRRGLLEHLERAARGVAIGAPTLLVTFAETEDGGPVAEALGYRFSRAFWHMERPIDGSFRARTPPDGVTIRPYVAPDDDRLGWELLTTTFADHFAIDPQTFEDYRADVLEHERRDPSLSAFAELRGETVGIVVGELIDDVGWIDDLGVVTTARGRGIGRALLEHGFALLAARGVGRLQLNVDSENATGATRLYESAGMTVRRSFDVFEKPLGPE